MVDKFGNVKEKQGIEKVLKKVGIALRSDNETFRETDEVLEDIAQKWQEFTDVEKNAIATAVAGTRQRENFIVLMENFETATKYAGTAANSTGTSFKKMKTYTDSLEGSVATLKGELQELWTSLVDSKVLIDVVKNLTSFVDTLNSIDWEGIKSGIAVIAQIGLAAATIGKLAQWIGALATAIKGFAVAKAAVGATAAIAGVTSAAVPLVGVVLAVVAAFIAFGGVLETSAHKIAEYQKELDELNKKEEEQVKLFKQYQELMTKSKAYGLTADEKENLVLISKELVDVYGLEADGVDNLTGAYNINNQALQENIDKLREQKNELLLAQKEERNKQIKDQLNKNQKMYGSVMSEEYANKIEQASNALKEKYIKLEKQGRVLPKTYADIAEQVAKDYGLEEKSVELLTTLGKQKKNRYNLEANWEERKAKYANSIDIAERIRNEIIDEYTSLYQRNGSVSDKEYHIILEEAENRVKAELGSLPEFQGNGAGETWINELFNATDRNTLDSTLTGEGWFEQFKQDRKDFIEAQNETAKLIQQNIVSTLGSDISSGVEDFFNEVSLDYISANATDAESQRQVEADLQAKLKQYNGSIERYVQDFNRINTALNSDEVTIDDYKNYFDNQNQKLTLIGKLFGENSETYINAQNEMKEQASNDYGSQLYGISKMMSDAGKNNTNFKGFANTLLQVENAYKSGEKSFEEYIDTIATSTDKMSLEDTFDNDTKAAAGFFNVLSEKGHKILENLAAQYDNNSLSLEEYIGSLSSMADYYEQLAEKAGGLGVAGFDSQKTMEELDALQTKLQGFEEVIPGLSNTWDDFKNLGGSAINTLAKGLEKLGVTTLKVEDKVYTGAKNIAQQAQKNKKVYEALQSEVATFGYQTLSTFGSTAAGVINTLAKAASSFSVTFEGTSGQDFWDWAFNGKDLTISPDVKVNTKNLHDGDYSDIDAWAVAQSGLGARKEGGGFTSEWTPEKQKKFMELQREAFRDIEANPENRLKYILAEALTKNIDSTTLFTPDIDINTGTGGGGGGGGLTDGDDKDYSDLEKYYAVLFQDLLSSILKDKDEAIKDFEEKNSDLNDDLKHALEMDDLGSLEGIYSAMEQNKEDFERELDVQIAWARDIMQNKLIPAINALVPDFAINSAEEMTNVQEQKIKYYFESQINQIEQDLHYLEQLADDKLDPNNKAFYESQLSDKSLTANIKENIIALEDRKNVLEQNEEAVTTNISTLKEFNETLKDNEKTLLKSQRDVSNYAAVIEGYIEKQGGRIDLLVQKSRMTGEQAIAAYEDLYQYLKSKFYPKTIEQADYWADMMDKALQKQVDRTKEHYEQIYADAGIIKDYEVGFLEDDIDEITRRYDEQIKLLTDKRDLQQETNDLIEAETRLRNAQREKNKRVYREGIGFVWEADRNEIQEAQKALDDLQLEKEISDLEKAKEAEIKAVQDSIDAWEKWYKELTREIDKVEYEHAKLRQGIVDDSRGMYYAVTETVNVYEKLKEAIEAAGKAQDEYNNFDPEDFETDFGENLTNEALQKAQAKYNQDKAEYDMALGDIENYKTWLQNLKDANAKYDSEGNLLSLDQQNGEYQWANETLYAVKQAEQAIRDGDEGLLEWATGVLEDKADVLVNNLSATYKTMQESKKALEKAQQEYNDAANKRADYLNSTLNTNTGEVIDKMDEIQNTITEEKPLEEEPLEEEYSYSSTGGSWTGSKTEDGNTLGELITGADTEDAGDDSYITEDGKQYVPGIGYVGTVTPEEESYSYASNSYSYDSYSYSSSDSYSYSSSSSYSYESGSDLTKYDGTKLDDDTAALYDQLMKEAGYAEGTLGAPGGLSVVGEQGAELAVLPRGTGILPNPITENLWKFGSNPNEYLDRITLASLGSSKGTPATTSTENNTYIDVGNVNLPNVINAKQFVQDLKSTVQRIKNT